MAKIRCYFRNCKLRFFAFYERAAVIKSKFVWIYNPPQIAEESNGITAGSVHRKEFVDFYGGYPEMVYILLQNRIYKSKEELYKSKTEEFLYWAEYLLRKRIVENIK